LRCRIGVCLWMAAQIWTPTAFSMLVGFGRRVATGTKGAGVVPLGRCAPAVAVVPQTNSSQLCMSATLALTAFGLLVGGDRRRKSARAGARSASLVQMRAREVVVELERSAQLLLKSGTVSSMDAFMAENSTAVALRNVEKTEEKPDDSGQQLCYLEPTNIGPFSTQVRLTVDINLPDSGECDINIMKIEAGSVQKKEGGGKFTRLFAHTKTRNSMSWKMGGEQGLEVTYTTFARAVAGLPFWFPFPDGWVKSAIEGQINQIVSSLQGEVMDRLQDKYQDWEAAAGSKEKR